MATIQPTQGLAEFLAHLRFESLPAAVRERTVDVILDTVACAFAGSADKDSAKVRELAEALGGPADFTVIAGRPQSLAGAVLLNGYRAAAGTALAPEHRLAGQFAPCVVAPALAAAEQRQASGQSLLTAVAAGLEVAARVERGMNWGTTEPVWHAAGVVGPFGSAAAVSSLLGGDVVRFRNALSLSGTQSAGTFAQQNTPTMRFHQARAGLSGLLAALLAETGFKAGAEILNADHGGLFRLLSADSDPQAAVKDLGTEWLFSAEPASGPDRSRILADFHRSAEGRLAPRDAEQAAEILAGLERLPELGSLYSCLRKAVPVTARED